MYVSSGQITIFDQNDSPLARLSNSSWVIPTDANGENGNFANCSTTLSVMLGQIDDSAKWTVVAVPSSGVVGSLSGKTYTVTAMSGDTGYVEFTASKAGNANQVVRFSLAKARAGADSRTITLSASSQVFTFDSSDSPSPSNQSITFTANVTGTTDIPLWSSQIFSGADTVAIGPAPLIGLTTTASLAVSGMTTGADLYEPFGLSMDASFWSKSGFLAFGSGSVANTTAVTDPLGGNQADYLVEDTNTVTRTIRRAATQFVQGVTYEQTVSAKDDGGASQRFLTLLLGAQAFGTNSGAIFNLRLGTYIAFGSVTVSMTASANGWYACTVTKVATATATSQSGAWLSNANNVAAPSYLGNGTSGIYLYGLKCVPKNISSPRCVVTATLGSISDSVTISKLRAGSDGLAVVLTNESHVLPAGETGVVAADGYTGSGTDIVVYEGTTQLTASATATRSAFRVGTITQSPASTITVGSVTYSSNKIVIGDHSAFSASANSVVLSIPITVYRADGTAATITKTQTVAKARTGTTGVAAITVVVPNSSVLLPSDSSGTVANYGNSGTTIQVYEGKTALTFVTGTLAASQFQIGAPTLSVASAIGVGAITGSGTTTATVANHSSMATATDAVTITYPLTIKRADGTTVTQNATQVIAKSKTGVAGVRTATLDMYQWSLAAPTLFPSGTSTYTWANGTFTAPATTNGWSLTPPAPVTGQTLWVARQVYSDSSVAATSTVTWAANTALPYSLAGTDGLTVVFSNEAHTAPATSAGAVSSYVGSGTTIRVLDGATALSAVTTITGNGQFVVGAATQTPASTITVGAVTVSGTTATVADHSAMSNATDTVSIAFPLTIKRLNGSTVNIAKNQTVTKSKAGPSGPNGSRGSRSYYLSGYTAWSDTAATTAASEGGGPIHRDMVTEYGTNFSQTKYYDSTTVTWNAIAAALDGNLLVSGSVVADKIDARGLSIKDTNGNVILSAGTALDWSRVGGTGRPENNATVGASASNFTGTIGGDNLLWNSDFERKNANNAPTGYNIYNGSSGVGASFVASTGIAGNGVGVMAGSTPGNTLGILSATAGAVEGGWVTGATYVVSFSAKKVAGAGLTSMSLRWVTAPTSTTVILNPSLTTSYQRYAFRITWGASVQAGGGFYISCANGSVIATGDEIHFDRIMIQRGDVLVDWMPSRRDGPRTTSGASAPTDPINNDIWIDTSVTPNVAKVRLNDAWQIAANYTTNTNQLTDGANLGATATWSGVSGSGKPADNATVGATAGSNLYDASGNIISSDAIKNNLIDLGFWKKDAISPWSLNAGYNRLCNAVGDVGINAGPKGVDDVVWYCWENETNGNGAGGWDATMISLDPNKAYRFVVPLRVLDGNGRFYWGTNNVCALNTTTANSNPYFVTGDKSNLSTDRWYLLVGYIFPYGSTNNSHESAGIWDCKTGQRVYGGTNYNHLAGYVNHRAYQFYATQGAVQVFGRPMINLLDGTEPSLREYFETSAVLNSALAPAIAAAQAAAEAKAALAETTAKAYADGKVSAEEARAIADATAKANAAQAAAIAAANTGLATKLSNNSRNVLSGAGGIAVGSLTWDTSGNRTGGSGIGITAKGMAAFDSGGVARFTLGADGNATFAGGLSAATGTFSGALTAQAINAVGTINIAGNAVTIPISVYAAGGLTLVRNTEAVVQQATITSSGAPIFIAFSASSWNGTVYVPGGDSSYYVTAPITFNIYRGVTLIRTVVLPLSGVLTVTLQDTPGIGNATYYVKAKTLAGQNDGSAVATVEARNLFLLETKR